MARTSLYSMRGWLGLLCTRPTLLVGFYGASSLKQQSAYRHVTPLWHIILILQSLVWPDRDSNEQSTALEARMLTIAPTMRFWLIGVIYADSKLSLCSVLIVYGFTL